MADTIEPREGRRIAVKRELDLAEVYDEHVWRVFGFFAYRLDRRQDAEDLTQMTFERAVRAWSRYDPERASVATWLLAIAHNLLIDHSRRRVNALTTPFSEEMLERPRAAQSDPAEMFGLEPELAAALAGLGQREREVIALRFGGDLTGPEIARLLDLSLSNVQQIMSRSLRRLRAELDEVGIDHSSRP